LNPIITTLLLFIPFVLPLGLALDLYLPSIPSMLNAFDASSQSIQLTMSVFLYTYGLGQLLMGPASDRWGRRNILLVSIILFSGGSIICFSADTLSIFMGGRILQALGACGTQVVSLAMVRDRYEGKPATIIFTALKGAMSIAPIIAPILGAFLQMHYGWRANFLVLTLYGLGMLGLGLYGLKETKPLGVRTKISWKFINAHFLYFCFCAIATQAAMFGYFSLSPRYFMTQFGLSEAQFALLFSANACIFLVTGILAGKVIFYLGFRKSTCIAAGMMLLSGLAMAYGHFNYTHYYVLFIPNLLASSSAAMMLGASTSGALMPYKENAGSASALLGCLEFMGGGLIGSLAIMGKTISALPLAICLVMLGTTIVMMNFRIT